jgi:choline transport protein
MSASIDGGFAGLTTGRYLGFVLVDGGTPLLFWGFVACATNQVLVYASLAEMSSM